MSKRAKKGFLTVTDVHGSQHAHQRGDRWVHNPDTSLLIFKGTELIGEYARGTWVAVWFAVREKR